MADQDARALLLTIQANTELLRSNLSAAERAIDSFTKTTEEHLDEGDKRFEAFGKSIERLEGPLERLKALGEIAVGALLGESLVEAGKKGLEFAGNVKFVSEQVGTSTDFLQKYRFAAGQFGVGTEEADTGLKKFARSVGEAANGNKAIIELFNRLGVNVRDAGGNVRSVESIFLDTANAIQKLDSPAQKTADTLTLMGRGAAGLKPLLAEGAAGFSELAAQAQALGVVLSPELIEHSEDVNHKLAALKGIVDAQMASAIAQNAGSIEVLASAFVKLAGGVATFLNNHPDRALALLGALAGSRFGAAGSVIGAGVGYVAGTAIEKSEEDDTGDLAKREAAFRDAAKRLYADQHTKNGTSAAASIFYLHSKDDPTVTDLPAALEEFNKQKGLYQQALIKHRSQAEGELGSDRPGVTNEDGGDLRKAQAELASLEKSKVGASGSVLKAYDEEIAAKKREIAFIKQGATAEMANGLAAKQAGAERKGEEDAKTAAHKAEELRQKNLAEDISYAEEVRKLREQILAGMRKTATNDAASDALQKEGINADAAAATAQNRLKFDKGEFGSDPKVAQARLDNLNSLAEQNRVQKLANVDIERQSQTVAQALTATQQDLQNRTALLQIQDAIATTSAQRRALELQLLDIQQRQVRAGLQKILDDQKASDFDKQQARKQLDALPPIEAAQRDQVIANTRTPGEQYAHDLNVSGGRDGFETAEVGVIQELGNNFEKAATSALKLHGILGSIASDLLKIAEQRLFEAPIANALFGASGSGGGYGGGSGLGGLLSSASRLFGGGSSNPFASFDGSATDTLTSINAGADAQLIASLPGLATGGSFVVGGTSGIDQNIMSINGEPTVKIGQGETVAVIPARTPSARQIGQERSTAMQAVVHVVANDYFDAKVASISGGQVQHAAPHIASAGATLGQQQAARKRSRTLG